MNPDDCVYPTLVETGVVEHGDMAGNKIYRHVNPGLVVLDYIAIEVMKVLIPEVGSYPHAKVLDELADDSYKMAHAMIRASRRNRNDPT